MIITAIMIGVACFLTVMGHWTKQPAYAMMGGLFFIMTPVIGDMTVEEFGILPMILFMIVGVVVFIIAGQSADKTSGRGHRFRWR